MGKLPAQVHLFLYTHIRFSFNLINLIAQQYHISICFSYQPQGQSTILQDTMHIVASSVSPAERCGRQSRAKVKFILLYHFNISLSLIRNLNKMGIPLKCGQKTLPFQWVFITICRLLFYPLCRFLLPHPFPLPPPFMSGFRITVNWRFAVSRRFTINRRSALTFSRESSSIRLRICFIVIPCTSSAATLGSRACNSKYARYFP